MHTSKKNIPENWPSILVTLHIPNDETKVAQVRASDALPANMLKCVQKRAMF